MHKLKILFFINKREQQLQQQQQQQIFSKQNTEHSEEMNTIIGESTKTSDFESGRSMLRYKIEYNDDLADKYVDIMSKNEMNESNKYNESKLLKRTSQLRL